MSEFFTVMIYSVYDKVSQSFLTSFQIRECSIQNETVIWGKAIAKGTDILLNLDKETVNFSIEVQRASPFYNWLLIEKYIKKEIKTRGIEYVKQHVYYSNLCSQQAG